MAPIRRYLRITKYSVLECRIYLDNPALAQAWLLHPRDPVLPRVIESVRPLVLPKLREERERERSRKKGKKRSIKDVVVEDDFEVSIFLTETDTRHSLLHKHKLFRDKHQTRLTSNSSRLLGGGGGASRDQPIDVERQSPQGSQADNDDDDDDVPILREEEDDDDQRVINLADIPAIDDDEAGTAGDAGGRPTKRRRRGTREARARGRGEAEGSSGGGGSDVSDDELFVGEDDAANETDGGGESASETSTVESGTASPAPKRRRGGGGEAAAGGDTADDDKKKMAMDISYEGFAIYGRVLCLVVKRRGGGGGAAAVPSGGSSNKPQTGRPGGQAMMENWIASTQLPAEEAEAL